MDATKWEELIIQAAKVLISMTINLTDNYPTVNAVLPFWQEFISHYAKLSSDDKSRWDSLKKPDHQLLFIARHYPQLQIQKFWAEAMMLAIANGTH
jgi:hypothetical protein